MKPDSNRHPHKECYYFNSPIVLLKRMGLRLQYGAFLKGTITGMQLLEATPYQQGGYKQAFAIEDLLASPNDTFNVADSILPH